MICPRRVQGDEYYVQLCRHCPEMDCQDCMGVTFVVKGAMARSRFLRVEDSRQIINEMCGLVVIV